MSRIMCCPGSGAFMYDDGTLLPEDVERVLETHSLTRVDGSMLVLGTHCGNCGESVERVLAATVRGFPFECMANG